LHIDGPTPSEISIGEPVHGEHTINATINAHCEICDSKDTVLIPNVICAINKEIDNIIKKTQESNPKTREGHQIVMRV
jgi:hypothetical protein